MLRPLLILLMLLYGSLTVMGQTTRESDYPYDYPEPYEPMIESDTSLFYRAVQQSADLYEELTRYNLSSVATALRGESFRERRFYVGGSEVSWRNFSLLRLLSLEENAPNALALFRNPEPATQRLRLNLTDRRYRFGVRYQLFHPMGRNASLSFVTDGRIGRDLRVEGVYTRSLRVALQVQKQWQERYRWALVAATAPSEQGVASSTTEEAYRLVGDRYYNPAWGFYHGDVRSARIRREFLPFISSGFEIDFNSRTTLHTLLSAEFGRRGLGSLGWFDARSPLPDNYRSLPSYYTLATEAERVAERWRSGDSRYTQIDWDELERQNRMSQRGSIYVEQEAVERLTDLKWSTELRSLLGRSTELRAGVRLHYLRSRNFRQVRDLLGGAYLLDIDYYLVDDDTYANSLQNNLRNPNRRVGEGDHFAYDYALERRSAAAFLTLDYHSDRWRAGGRVELEQASCFRKGFYEKELFAGSGSHGMSRTLSFSPFEVEGGVGYAFSPRHYLSFTGGISQRLPALSDLFLNPEYNNRLVENPAMQQLYKAELAYRGSGIGWSGSLTAFARLEREGMETLRYYDDLEGVYCDRVVEHLSELCYGLEAALRLYVGKHWRVEAAASAQQACYAENPYVTIYADNDNRLLSRDSESHVGDCHPGGIPLFSALLGANYHTSHWGCTLTGCWLGMRYAHPDFMRRTVRVAEQAADSPEAFARFMDQERLSDAWTLDASVWGAFAVAGLRFTLSLSVKNLLNDQSTPYDAYEPARIRRLKVGDAYTYQPFDNRLTYRSPRTAYLSLALRF